jgi:hypothetical protein
MDILRDQLGTDQPAAPSAPPTGARAPGASAARSQQTTTRNGTAVVADADEESDDDEPPPMLIPEERSRRSPTRARAGYDSDTSMPALQVVSDSSDEEDNDGSGTDDSNGGFHDDDDDEDDEDDSLDTNLFFRLFGIPLDAALGAAAPELRPRSHMQTTEPRPSSSARFSTVVDRSRSGSGGASASANRSTPVAPGSPGGGSDQSISLQEWAENILRMDEPEDSDDDDDEPMPPLEPVPHHDVPPSSSSASSSPPPVASLQQTRHPMWHQHRDVDTDSESDSPPPLISTLPSVSAPSRQPSVHNAPASRPPLPTVQLESGPALIPAEGAPSRKAERKATVQQEFTTDGRGRVISIGGPELPASASFAEPQTSDHQLESRSDVSEEHEEEAPRPPAPVAIQRKSSEFTTDGRGRVISVGHSVSSGSSGVSGITQDGQRSTEVIDNEGEEPRGSDDEDGHSGRGLFAWFNGLF